jgi:hypothetical protein
MTSCDKEASGHENDAGRLAKPIDPVEKGWAACAAQSQGRNDGGQRARLKNGGTANRQPIMHPIN